MNVETMPPNRNDVIARIKAERAFAVNLSVYLLVNAVLVSVWAVTRDDGDSFWPIWTIGLWGIGIVGQAWHTYGPGQRSITDVGIDREMRRRGGVYR